MADLTQTPEQVQADLDAVEASKVGLASISDSADTRSTAVKKSGFHSLEANSSNAPDTDRAVLISAVRNTAASGEIRYGQIAITESGKLYWAEDTNGTLGAWNEGVSIAEVQTLTNKTLAAPVISGDLINAADSTGSLGSTAVRWLKGWFDTLTAGTLTLGAGSIVDSSGAIDFGNENLSTTGTLDAGNTDITGTLGASGAVTLANELKMPNNKQISMEEAGGSSKRILGMGSDNNLRVNLDGTGKTIIYSGAAVAATFDASQNTALAGTLGVSGLATLNTGVALGTATTLPTGVQAHLSAAETASMRIDAKGTSGSNAARYQLYSEGVFKGQLSYSEAAGRTQIWGSNGSLPAVEIDGAKNVSIPNGTLDVTGAVSKGSGSFKISHPLPELTDTHHLVHSFTESPQADLLYSGVADLVKGTASINIDTFHSMTEGTFEVLCRNVRTFSSNETGFHHVRCSVEGNILSLDCEDSDCTDTVSWLVIGERKDQHMFDTGWTNENGEVIVEPLKPEPVPEPEPVQRTVQVAIREEYNQIVPAVLDDVGEVVEEERTTRAIRQVTKIETVDVPESIELIDGVATLIPATTEEKPVPQFETLGVFDTEGNPVY